MADVRRGFCGEGHINSGQLSEAVKGQLALVARAEGRSDGRAVPLVVNGTAPCQRSSNVSAFAHTGQSSCNDQKRVGEQATRYDQARMEQAV